MDPPNDPLPVLLHCYAALQHAREALSESQGEPPYATRWGPRSERVGRVLARVDEALAEAEPFAIRSQREDRGGAPLGPSREGRGRSAA